MKHKWKLLLGILLPVVLLVVLSAAVLVSYLTGMGTYVLWEVLLLIPLLLILAAAAFLLFVYPKTRLSHSKIFQIPAFVAVFALTFAIPMGLRPNALRYDPVVYAVGTDYQIVWNTSMKSTAWVEIGGERYYDAVSGAIRSEDRVHKVSVPMEKLDAAKQYTVGSQSMIKREAYYTIKGKEKTKTYSFRPVDFSDGVQFYNISDTHDFADASAQAGQYWGDRLDFLVLGGDIASTVSRLGNILNIFDLAGKITRGERPVIYARGNHETRGELAPELDRYVGAQDGKLYYTLRLGSLWGIVLDAAEDKPDDHPEYGGTAAYEPYRVVETGFLDGVIADSAREYDAPGVAYRFVFSHTDFTDADAVFDLGVYRDWTARLNEMRLDMAVCGHEHELLFRPENAPEGTDGDRPRNFPVLIGSRRVDALAQTGENQTGKAFTGTAVEIQGDMIHMRFTNSAHAVLEEFSVPLSGVR